MAEQTKQATPDNRNDSSHGDDQRLRGGTQGGEVGRVVDVNLMRSGTPGISSPSGDVHIEPPARAVPRTDMPARDVEEPRLAGGKTPDDIRAYLADLDFPAKKDSIVRAVRRNGAPEDVIGAVNLLNATEYGSFEQLMRDYPRLPDRDDVDPNKGKT